MNKLSLSSLYRRLTESQRPGAVDAGDLAAAAEGTLPADRREQVAESLASSPIEAKLVRMLRALKSDSEVLAADVARTSSETTHRRHARHDRRIAAGRRSRGMQRWVAAAACLVAVVGAWTLQHNRSRPDAATASAAAVARADVIFKMHDGSPDRIFGGQMDAGLAQHGQKARREGDALFHGDFSGG